MVYYLKYRPQKIDDLDNAAVRETLYSLLKKGVDEVPHAFLFTGPKGLGKTSAARIIAKAINCKRVSGVSRVPGVSKVSRVKNGEDLGDKSGSIVEVEPCNECDSCKAITNGTNMDILEIDAASNRGIDEIRDLKEKIKLAPLSSRKKVYIIDEVHMLTTEAFNALLKTLEEPPAHAVFILCTTEPHKVPKTILSRCFHIAFKLATKEELIRSFKRIAQGEKITIDEEALQMIADLSEGGFRDGAKILEELASSNSKISKALIEEKYQVASIHHVISGLIVSLNKRDIKKSLQQVREATALGIDMKYFTQQLIELLHTELLTQIGIENGPEAKKYDLPVEDIKLLIEVFSKANGELKYAVIQQLPLELAIIEYITYKNTSETVQNEPNNNTVQIQRNITSRPTNLSDLRKQAGAITKIKALYGTEKSNVTQKKADDSGTNTGTISVTLMQVPAEGEMTREWQEMLWKNIIAEMKIYNHTVAGVLRGCTIKNFDKQQLIIETAYKFHKERLDEMRNREALAKVCKMLIGKEVKIEVELKKE